MASELKEQMRSANNLEQRRQTVNFAAEIRTRPKNLSDIESRKAIKPDQYQFDNYLQSQWMIDKNS